MTILLTNATARHTCGLVDFWGDICVMAMCLCTAENLRDCSLDPFNYIYNPVYSNYSI